MTTIQDRLAAMPMDSVIPVCPICNKPLGRRPVSFVNSQPWCRSCFVLLMKIRRMEVFAAGQSIDMEEQ